MSSPIKEGYLQRYRGGLIPNRWKSNFVVLYSDSTLVFFNNTGDGKPHETVTLKNVVQYTAVGSMCDRLPVRRPSFPLGVRDKAVNRLICIGMDSQASKAHWILFPSERILELIFFNYFWNLSSWIFAIISTLTQPPPQPSPQPTLRPIGWCLPIPDANSSSCSNSSVPAAANAAAGTRSSTGTGKPTLAAGLKVASGLATGAGKVLSVSLQAFRFGYMLATLGGDS
ncbi:unnamed protein product [Meloidogyne enterolobii]|uniref:Uncharacterized protein n=1 Tax=Meloidogyne enterolobii TaxID=390850 RepID=A0ACB1AK25_MELEN